MAIRTLEVDKLVTREARSDHSSRMGSFFSVGREDSVWTKHECCRPFPYPSDGPCLELLGESSLDIFRLARPEDPTSDRIDPKGMASRLGQHLVPCVEQSVGPQRRDHK